MVDLFFFVQFEMLILKISVLQRSLLAFSLLEEYLMGYLKDPLHAAPRSASFATHICIWIQIVQKSIEEH